MKKVLLRVCTFFVLVGLMVGMAIPVSAEVDSGNCGENGSNVTWSFDPETGILTISGDGGMDHYGGAILPWHSRRQQIKNVIIEGGVTSVGDFAFSSCSNLTSITIPNSVTSIGMSAFNGCSSLTSIMIPDSVTSIDWYAFSGCSTLTSITIPNGVTRIYDYAFFRCSSLTSITIPNSVTRIDRSAFEGCSRLIQKENGVSYVDGWVVDCDESATSIALREGTVGIADYAFHSCSSLTSVTFPNSVTSISYGAFSGCSSLTNVTIGNSVTSIGDYAFHSCSSLASVTIPNSVTKIGVRAFFACSRLTSITIPDSVKSICYYAFSECSSLTSITIPSSLTSIGGGAFEDCNELTSAYYHGTETLWNEISIGEGNEELTNVLSFVDCSYGDWVTVTEATEDAEGLKEKVCECGDKITEVIPKLPKAETPTVETPEDNSIVETPNDNSIENTPTKVVQEDEGMTTGEVVAISAGGTAVVGVGGASIWWFAIKKKKFADLINLIRKT